MLQPAHAVAVPPSAAYPLHVTAKCYRPAGRGAGDDEPDALTFIFLHSAGFHKEMFEPTIEALFAAAAHSARPRVREAWAIECPTHGESAVLNEAILRRPEWDDKCQQPALLRLRGRSLTCTSPQSARRSTRAPPSTSSPTRASRSTSAAAPSSASGTPSAA